MIAELYLLQKTTVTASWCEMQYRCDTVCLTSGDRHRILREWLQTVASGDLFKGSALHTHTCSDGPMFPKLLHIT